MDTCVNCGINFKKLSHEKTYKRRSLGSSLRAHNVDKKINEVLSEDYNINITPKSLTTRFLCEVCQEFSSLFQSKEN